MPKISAPSVADHRARQRRALVDAARELLEEGDAARLTFAAVAERTGLARNSVYKYFGGRHELLAAVIEDAAPRWAGAIDARMASAGSPEERVAAHVLAQLDLVRQGEHRIAQTVARDRDAAVLRESARQAHEEILAPLVTALTDLGDDDPRQTAVLLQGFVNAATTSLETGADFDGLARRTVDLAVASLGALGTGGRTHR